MLVLFFLFVGAYGSYAQKYILLDTQMSESPFYANEITVADKVKRYFPVEKKEIEKFIEVLEEITGQLSSVKKIEKARQYEIGCIRFSGVAFSLRSKNRIDYVLTSTCSNIKISMHLSDGKISNESNAYFIKTWIDYIRNFLKRK
ncbi:MAG: hypothetical protein ABI237_05510 [Ginsengibacter sp.]